MSFYSKTDGQPLTWVIKYKSTARTTSYVLIKGSDRDFILILI